MEFGSKYAYTYSGSEDESVSEDEFEAGMDSVTLSSGPVLPRPVYAELNHSCRRNVCSDMVAQQRKQHKWMFSRKTARAGAEPEPLQTEVASESAQIGKKWRRADTNVVAIKFDQLKKPSNMHTGDPVSCQHCNAMMSHLSSVTDHGDDQVWQCEFCDEPNVVDILPDEIPRLADVTYMLKPAAATTATSCAGVDESMVVFCIDISGSMCVSQQVEGRMKLRGSHADRYRSLNTSGENQWLPGQNRNVTFITRLQALQAAVDHQLEQLAKDHPTRKAALVSFNNEVQVIGDGTVDPVVIAGDKLNDKTALANIASSLPLPTSIQTTRESLGEKLFDLEEGGQTALGPAMLVAISMASKVPGSKVVMCTDGLANVGLGNLDSASADKHAEASSFFSQLADNAKENGVTVSASCGVYRVTVSVLTIAGTDCKLVELGAVASETGGQVNIVDPLKLTEEFCNILANPVIASRVVATFIVHKGLYIRGEADRSSCVKRDVGNVTIDTEITFEYGIHTRTHEHPEKCQNSASVTDEQQAEATVDISSEPVNSQQTSDDDVSQAEPMQTTTAATDESDQSSAAASMDAAVAVEGPSEQVQAGFSSDTGQSAGTAAAATSAKWPSELPFQVQINYTDLDGAEAVRVLTQTQPVTRDRQKAETSINMPVVGAHAAQQSSRMALDGQYTPARLNAFMYQRLVSRNVGDAAYNMYLQNVVPMENKLRDAQLMEARTKGQSVACYEDEDEEMGDPTLVSKSKPGLRGRLSRLFGSGGKTASASSHQRRHHEFGKTVRRQTCSDEMSSELYSKKQVSSRMFTPRAPSPPSPHHSGSDSSDDE